MMSFVKPVMTTTVMVGTSVVNVTATPAETPVAPF
jgi:hypothetical protein